MHYAPGWGGNGDKNSTPTELFWAGTKLGHPQKPQVFQFCSGPVYFCLRIVTAQNKYFYGTKKKVLKWVRNAVYDSTKLGEGRRAQKKFNHEQGRSLGVKSGQIDPISFGPMEKNGSGQKKKKKL